MKKIMILGVALIGMLFGNVNTSNAQVEQGNFIIDPYYGFPNFGKNLVDLVLPDSAFDVKATGIGPCGLRFEYMVADNFGVGFDFIYNSAGFSGNYTDTDSTGATVTYTDELIMRRIRAQVRVNWHFVQTEALDAYLGGGAGYNTRLWSVNSNNPNYTEPETVSGALLPVSARICVGARYYFIPNLGLNLELGIGGPIVSGGVSVKF